MALFMIAPGSFPTVPEMKPVIALNKSNNLKADLLF